VEVGGAPVLMKEKHLRVPLKENGRTLMFKGWDFGPRAGELAAGTHVDAVFCLEEDSWSASRGYPGWGAVLKDVRPAALYLHAGGKLSFDPPDDAAAAYDEYVSDPAKPVPLMGNIVMGMAREYMVADQRFAASRPDVLVYSTEPLEQDVTIAGPLTPSLFVSTSGTDSDFDVKLIDVYPNDGNPGGYQQLVRGEPFRGRFRNGYDKPEAFEPNKTAKLEYAMPDVYHTFRRGHRIMVQVQSSWFPLTDRNPQKFVDIYKAKPEDFQKATERVYRSKQYPSAVKVGLLQ
jgi:putative CocE/NonD family hydrolase